MSRERGTGFIYISCLRPSPSLFPPNNSTTNERRDDSDSYPRMMLSLRQTPLVAPNMSPAMAPATEPSVTSANALQSRILEVRPPLSLAPFSLPAGVLIDGCTTVPRAAGVTRDLCFVRRLGFSKCREKTFWLTISLSPFCSAPFPALFSTVSVAVAALIGPHAHDV